MPSRGNPNWDKPEQSRRTGPTEFDMEVRRLQLTREQYVASTELRHWCDHNRNRVYVPEWLLKEWRIGVVDTFDGAA